MSFKFRFEAILQLRRRERDEAGADVGQAIAAIAKVDAQIAEIEQTRRSLRQADQAERVGNVSVDSLLSSGRYDMQLQADIGSLQETRQKLTAELQRRQDLLVLAEAEMKKYEKLEEKQRQEHDENLRKQEQAEADEATSRQYAIALRKMS